MYKIYSHVFRFLIMETIVYLHCLSCVCNTCLFTSFNWCFAFFFLFFFFCFFFILQNKIVFKTCYRWLITSRSELTVCCCCTYFCSLKFERCVNYAFLSAAFFFPLALLSCLTFYFFLEVSHVISLTFPNINFLCLISPL